ncbi:MAG: ribosome hibernation-promoting factor, HPF/YfiA family [Bacteroidia bacterium]
MTTQIQSVHFDADTKLLSHVEEKVGKLKTFHGSIITSNVILRLDKDNENSNKVAEIKLNASGMELFAKKQCSTFEEAVDSACDALKTQIKKHKEKTISLRS